MKTVYTPISFDSTVSLPVMEHFYTLQGEGANTGRAAYFIRLAGCDVGCTWCDVKESWPVETSQLINLDQLIETICSYPVKLIVITGGEPTLYDLTTFTSILKNKGFEIALETSGTNVISGHFDFICLSPKKFKPALEVNFSLANELKVIVYNQHDFDWALDLSSKVNSSCSLYLQAEWDKSEQFNSRIVEFIKSHPEWKLSLQTHKYLNIP